MIPCCRLSHDLLLLQRTVYYSLSNLDSNFILTWLFPIAVLVNAGELLGQRRCLSVQVLF